jgi:hypothetical protein
MVSPLGVRKPITHRDRGPEHKGPDMPSRFNLELSMREAPAEAQSRAATALTEPARAVGLRLAKRGAGEFTFKPRVQFPFLIMLWHNLNREHMKVTFATGDGGGTRVTISGAVARGRQPLAADPEHWTEALGGSAQAAH